MSWWAAVGPVWAWLPVGPYAANKSVQRAPLYADELDRLNREYAVIQHPDELAGWHISGLTPSKPGVLRYFATQRIGATVHSKHGYITQDVLRVAIETHVINKPDGFTTAP